MEYYEITTPQEKKRVAPLFADMTDSLIETFLQGHAGQSFCDDLAYPRCAIILCNDFLFVGGDAKSPNAQEFIASIGDVLPTSASYVVIPCEDSWLPMIELAFPAKTTRFTRYAMGRDVKAFDKDHLRKLTRQLPAGYVMLGMDEELYDLANQNDWSKDFCIAFTDEDDFLDRGIGFCVLFGEELVSGASSFQVFDQGIEVQIATHKDHRRKGLAKACGSALILSCLAQKRIPCWDAANEASLALAKELGYTLHHSYTALDLSL